MLMRRSGGMTDQTEIRVIELRAPFKPENPFLDYRYAIQYRNSTTHGLWKVVPVVQTTDTDHYWCMHGGADD